MCVTCTDMGVLAGHNYPEKAYAALLFARIIGRLHPDRGADSFTHYGGVCVNAEYSHEVVSPSLLASIARPPV